MSDNDDDYLSTGHSLGRLLLDALGIDAEKVHSITLDCVAGEAAVVRVTRFVTNAEGERCADSCSAYEVVEKG